jgi:hypothetical protein
VTDDPLRRSPHLYGDPLNAGRVLHDNLTATDHYMEAFQVIAMLDRDDLEQLALYVAADAAATRGEEQGSGDVWTDWWRGIGTTNPDDPPDMESTPAVLRRIVRPPEDDDPDRAPDT